ncbi:hypothetical protein EDB84DRAFT_1560889 [Lactarius hengduanensis]|nr:hypothetical protein EDB84DRAFT_1560889 [Lactarius hengduanensis]
MHDDSEDDIFNPSKLSLPRMDFRIGNEDEDELEDYMGTQLVPRPQLRSRPPIDFAGRSAVNTGVGPPFNVATRPPSGMSDSTLHSGLGHSAAYTGMTFPRKMSSSPTSVKLVPVKAVKDRPTPDVIASLTVAELFYNPHYLKLREEFDHVSRALATQTVSRSFTGSLTAKCDTLVPDRDYRGFTRRNHAGFFPDSYQAPPLRSKDSHVSSLGPHTEDSRASSLGPSDSASQQMRYDPAYDKAIESLLGTVEPSLTRPQFLSQEVLWYSNDCDTDKKYGDIITKKNKYRPKMNLAVRRPDGSRVSPQEFSNIRHSTLIIYHKLIKLAGSDPRAMRDGDSKPPTMTFIKNLFKTDYDKAVLELEAEHKLLRLCTYHWKAEALIGQMFRGRSEIEASSRARAAASMPPDDTPDPPTASIPQVWDAAPVNAAKRAFELSPGPKSPSASHAQKRSKDGIVALFGQKTTRPSVPSNQPPRARKLVPTFLGRTEVINAEPEPASTNLRPVSNPQPITLSQVLTSDFPSLTNAASLIRSMNAHASFKQGKPSNNVTALLERIQFADPGSPDIDEDNTCQSWGHDLFTAGGISPSSSLTTWEDVGSAATAFKLVAAALKTCREARQMCVNAGTPKMDGFISDIYLEQILECLEKCWVGAGGTITSSRVPVIPTTPNAPSYRDVAMSPPKHPLKLKIKRPTPITNVIAPTHAPAPTEKASTSAQQPAVNTGPTQEPSAALDEGTRADAASLKHLQVSELLTWIGDNKISVPKSKRKDDLVAAILESPEFAQVSKSTIQEIVDNRKPKKGSKRQLAAPP